MQADFLFLNNEKMEFYILNWVNSNPFCLQFESEGK